jgi:hypothetical protein
VARIGQVKVQDDDSGSVRLTDRISLGVLADLYPRDVLEDVLTETGRREKRSRSLPAHVMMRFCMAMCLFFDDDYEEVMRKLVGSLRSWGSWRGDWKVPTTSALTQARQRLSVEPLRVLFERTAVPVAGKGTKGAWLGTRRLMAIDGFLLDLPDTPGNTEEFGKKGGEYKPSAFPQALIMALAECGSHAIIGAAITGCNGNERLMAEQLLPAVAPDMLVTADRHLYSFDLWRKFRETGADLLWRVGVGVSLPVLTWLPDGSYLSIAFHPKQDKKQRAAAIRKFQKEGVVEAHRGDLVRVVDYEIPDREGSETGELVTVMTSILEPADVTAPELAAAYHERWEIENTFDEIKTHQRGKARVLRSQSPDMAKQEIWAFLLAHYGVRALMCRAADEIGEDPDRLSFMRSVRVIRRHIVSQADFSP